MNSDADAEIRYTRADAIQDGSLIDVSEAAKEIGFLHRGPRFHDEGNVGHATGMEVNFAFAQYEGRNPGSLQVFPKLTGCMRRNVEQRILRQTLRPTVFPGALARIQPARFALHPGA